MIRPVATRWTAFFLAYSRLLRLKPILDYIVVDDNSKDKIDQILIWGKLEARRKAEQMIAIINNKAFWDSLARYTVYFIYAHNVQLNSIL